MAMKFLSKKSFHVRRLDNIAKVARAEEKMREEQTKMAELRREREEEMDLEELRRAQEASGRVDKAPVRVEWMYKAPQLVKKDDDPLDDAKEKARMNYESLPPEAKLSYPKHDEIVKSEVPGSKFLTTNKFGAGDIEMKKREDPFTLIINKKKEAQLKKQREQELIEKVQRYHHQRKRYDSDSDSSSSDRCTHNRVTKEKHSSDSSTSSTDDERRHKRHHRHRHHHRRRSRERDQYK